MLKGKGEAIIDGKKYDLEKGDVLTVFPNQLHEYRNSENEEFFITIFRPEILPEYKDIFYNKVPVNNVYKGGDKLLFDIVETLPEIYHGNDTNREYMYRGLLLAFFAKLFSKYELTKTKSADLSVVKSILNYCNENYKENINLESIANHLHISKYYISHLLNDKLGISFNDYLNSLRIADAASLLELGECDISEIAGSCGFNTLRTFNRAFRSVQGMSPSEYRKNFKTK
jgi:AraC-like DNA-binding protein